MKNQQTNKTNKERPRRPHFSSMEACPSCGNEIRVSAGIGEIRSCEFCKWRYIVVAEIKKNKIIQPYNKARKKTIAG